ncbi:uncharacterized protein [Gossypium hirsutum]|uniref:Uncharacterized protein n=1 Tax=Gossypium hirsutum TaxID=3635 RepID=A0A1U8MZS4_GOSHI|nr:uncharacterized protein LOC107941960 [Gossypium hirsutum]
MPNYMKFMKDILSKKCRLGEFEIAALTEGCTTMLMNKLPPKLMDLGSFTIPCSIGNCYIGKALCDLGAIINLMPMYIFKKLGIKKVRPTTMVLELADLSYAHREEYKADHDAPIILGRPFFATGRTLIDVRKGELTMRVNNQQVTFNLFDALKYIDENEECHAIDLIETTIDEFVKFCYSNSDSEDNLMEQGDTLSFEELGEFMEA